MDNFVSFRNMQVLDFQKYYDFKVKNYAKNLIHAGFLPEDLALSKAQKDFSDAFEDGFQTENTFFYFIVNQNNEDIGFTWYRIYGNTYAYLLEIFIFEEYQNQGYGFKTLNLLENELRAKSMEKIGLNVFNFNTRAIHLYEKVGFQAVHYDDRGRQMEKIL